MLYLALQNNKTWRWNSNQKKIGPLPPILPSSLWLNQAEQWISIQIEIEDITDRRRTLQQLEEKEKLLEIIGSLTEIFHPAKRKTRQKTINGVLEQIGLVSLAQYTFVSRIDPVSNLLFTEFKWQETDIPKTSNSTITLPLDTLHPVFEKLQKGITYIA